MVKNVTRSAVLCCDHCGHPYSERRFGTAESGWCLPIQCPRCFITRRIGPAPIAVLLQPVIAPNDMTKLLVLWSDDSQLTLPSAHIRRIESGESAIVRETEDAIGIALNPKTLRMFACASDPQKGELYLFYENTQRIHQRALAHFKPNAEVTAIQIIETTYGMEFVRPSYQETADKFTDNLWRHFHP